MNGGIFHNGNHRARNGIDLLREGFALISIESECFPTEQAGLGMESIWTERVRPHSVLKPVCFPMGPIGSGVEPICTERVRLGFILEPMCF